MIIFDISAIAYLMLHQLKDDMNVNLLRHAIINKMWSTLTYLNNEGYDTSEVIVACDSKDNWRRDIHVNYKGSRKKSRAKQEVDWTEFFDGFNTIIDEFKVNMPFKTIKIDKAEADDIVAVICMENKNREIIIVSPDKDFRQLCNDNNILLFSPKSNVGFIDTSDYCLFEHIIKGDSEDDIPNVLSDINVFYDGIRQTTLSAKKKQQLIDYRFNLENSPIVDDMVMERINTNKQLIDFNYIPSYIKNNIISEVNSFKKPKGKLFNYFVKNKLTKLMEIGAFR